VSIEFWTVGSYNFLNVPYHWMNVSFCAQADAVWHVANRKYRSALFTFELWGDKSYDLRWNRLCRYTGSLLIGGMIVRLTTAANEGSRGIALLNLNLGARWRVWWTPRAIYFTSKKRASLRNEFGGWVGARAGLDALGERKISFYLRESGHDPAVVDPVGRACENRNVCSWWESKHG